MSSIGNSVMPGANRWLFIGFSAVWLLLLFVSYWAFHPYYSLSLSEQINYDILLALLVLSGGAAAWLQSGKGKRTYNGLMVYGFVLLLQGVTVGIYGGKQNLFDGSALGGGLLFMGFNFVMHLALFLIILVMYTAGQLVMKRLSPWYVRDSRRILSIAIGISLVGLVLFLLGLAGLLYNWLLGPLFLGLLVWQRKPALEFLQSVLLKPVKVKKDESIGWQIPIFLLLISISVNGIYAVKLFPLGFDGSGLYMNTTHLISEYNALPAGGQAYNWQLFLSLGELLYGQMSLSMMMAHFSGLLCAYAIFRIARLFVPRQQAWLAAALFYLSPATNFHLTLDEKVDLGFLFITLSTLLLLLEYRVRLRGKKELPQGQTLFRIAGRSLDERSVIWLLAGWLAGYAFGIKYTGIMAIFAFLSYGVYQRAGGKAGAGTLAAMVFLLFLTGIYRFGYLELGNTLPVAVAGVSLAIALPLLVLGFRGKKDALRSTGRMLLVFAIGGFLSFLPWMGKNLLENRQLGISALVEGQAPTPRVRLNLPARSGQVNVFGRLQEALNKRGIRLSPEQEQKARGILQEYAPQVAAFERGQLPAEERERYIKEVRQRIRSEVLSAQQKAQFGINAITGVGEDDGVLEGGKREEVKRYMGYEAGLPLYLSLPYDMTMNTNVRYLKYLDIGIYFMLFFPLLLFSWRGGLSVGKNAVVILLSFLVLGISVYSVYANGSAPPTEQELSNAVGTLSNKHPLPFDGLVTGPFQGIQETIIGIMRPLQGLYAGLAGFSFFMVFLCLAALAALGYWLMKERIDALSPNFKALLAFLFSFGFFWYLLGSGIPWYGFPFFTLLGVVFVYFVHKPERLAPKATAYARYFMLTGIGITLFFSTILNFLSTTEAEENAGMRFQNAFVKYGALASSKEEAQFEFNPIIVELRKFINQDIDSKVYRVGTYFNYHITQNDRRVYEDNQLGLFGDYLAQSRNPQQFLDFLKKNGFKYVLFDLNTAGLDETPEQSLAKKANQFFRILVNSPRAQLLFTDNLVRAPKSERSMLGRMRLSGQLALRGETIQAGSFALFEIQ